MPTNHPNHAAPPAFYAPAPLLIQTTGFLQSPHSAEVEKLIADIVEKWNDVERAANPDVNDIDYRAMPPVRVLKFKARVRVRGKARPLSYEIDDSEE